MPQHSTTRASWRAVAPSPSRPVPPAVADVDDDMPARAPSALNTGKIISIETIDPLTGKRAFTRCGADSAPPALRTAAHGASMSGAPGHTQPATSAAQAAPHAFGACHNNPQQPAAEHCQGNARRMPVNTQTVDPPSAHASRAAAASALSLAGHKN